jgi:hypothetical protein
MTGRRAAPVACALALAMLAAPAALRGADTPPRSGGYSVKDSPGYIPLVDPESTSVTLGRRPNAPIVSKPFRGGAASLDSLGRAVCRVLERPSLDSLMSLTVSQDEFREILWPEFPQSRPVTGLTWEDAWRVLYPRLLNGCNGALMDHAGGAYEFIRFERDSVDVYKNFKLHSGLVLVARNGLGDEERFGWIRSVAERKGRFKIYSMTD